MKALAQGRRAIAGRRSTAFVEALQAARRTSRRRRAGVAGRDRACCRATSSAPLLGRGRLGSLVYQGTHRALGVPVAIRVLKRDDQPHWDAVRARFLLEARTLQVVASQPAAGPRLRRRRSRRLSRHRSDRRPEPAAGAGRSRRVPVAARRPVILPGARRHVGAARARRLHLRRQSRHDPHSRVSERDVVRLADERIVISSAGIKSVQDVLATMREQELRGQEASANELPYVAPEVLMGGAPNPRADVFTIGVLAYQMVTGRVPFKAASLPELIGQMLQTKPAPPQQHSRRRARRDPESDRQRAREPLRVGGGLRARARMTQADRHYRPDIDGLRALAVGVVVVFHAFPVAAARRLRRRRRLLRHFRLSDLGDHPRRQGRRPLQLRAFLRAPHPPHFSRARRSCSLAVLAGGWFLLYADDYARARPSRRRRRGVRVQLSRSGRKRAISTSPPT